MSLRSVVTVGREREVQQLARHIGRQVFAADDVTEAADIAKRVDPELILFDHRFAPDCIQDFLRTTGNNSHVHIVAIGNRECHRPSVVRIAG